MHQARFHIVLLVLIVLVLTTPAVSAGVVVHDQDEYEKAAYHHEGVKKYILVVQGLRDG